MDTSGILVLALLIFCGCFTAAGYGAATKMEKPGSFAAVTFGIAGTLSLVATVALCGGALLLLGENRGSTLGFGAFLVASIPFIVLQSVGAMAQSELDGISFRFGLWTLIVAQGGATAVFLPLVLISFVPYLFWACVFWGPLIAIPVTLMPLLPIARWTVQEWVRKRTP